ncbi:amino acid ABC transporter permease [Lacticaseibacillus camelliae]|uniref:Amino acid ABC transporter permease n=1 Tax=Lacticaseibacillus camelliae DSM 22697 = JCM 13995 TaxID=1423730 RepID=A0A0R2FE27_9LACO|nr:amino acid ABC transporter permease [Lacticaseibacillus camelliae]KRN25595.1 amino acid ABC transporter permease [Lacticaseibacillus camelliae DSM 22697 = JCM 13995]
MSYINSILPALMDGVKMTLGVFFLTLIGAIPLGMLVSVGLIQRGKNILAKAGKAILSAYIWVFRGTPLLLQLIFVFYGLPLIGIVFDRFSAVIFTFILNYAAYFAEIYRGGFGAVEEGQFEAATVLNMTRWQTLRYVVIPQVLKIVLPSMGNEVINLVKDSSLVYVIGLGDLLRAGEVATSRDVTLVPLVLVAVIYLVMTLLLTLLQRRVEKSFSYYK